ncbi:MAG: hypothetical protein PVG14_04310 [Anaerolineales bacterium]
MHAVFLVVIADVAHIGVADSQAVDVVAVDPVLLATIDGQVSEADIAGVDHVYWGVAAGVSATGQVGAVCCICGHFCGQSGIGQVHIADGDILRVDQFDAMVVEVLQGAAATICGTAASDDEVARAGVVEGDTDVSAAGTDAEEGDAAAADGCIADVDGRTACRVDAVGAAADV